MVVTSDLGSGHSLSTKGNSTVMQVPCSGVLSTAALPPSNLARSRNSCQTKAIFLHVAEVEADPPVLNSDP